MSPLPPYPGAHLVRWMREHAIVVALAVVLAVAAGILLTGRGGGRPETAPPSAPAPHKEPCTPGDAPWTWKTRVDGDECVGFSADSTDVLAQGNLAISEALRDIGELNRRTGARGLPTVTVVAMVPLGGDERARPIDVLGGLFQLRGMLAAAQEHNGDGSNQRPGTVPLVRIVVADVGSRFRHAETVARRVLSDAERDPSFAAVIGLNQGRGTTGSAIALLDQARVPMISTTASTDDLTEPQAGLRPYARYWRIAARNLAEARFIGDFLRGLTPAVRRPYIVWRDADPYSLNLAEDVRDVFYPEARGTGGWAHGRSYDDSDRLRLADRLDRAVDALCAPAPGTQPYDAVVFTGRSDETRELLAALDRRGCGPLPIVGGDDLSLLEGARALDRQSAARRVDLPAGRPLYFVDYAATDPVLWPAGGDGGTHPFFEHYARANPGVPVSGTAMAAYDALLVLAQALPRDLPRDGPALRERAAAGLGAVCGPGAVRGATGIIAFDAYGDPVRKALVMRRFAADGPSPVVGRTGDLTGRPEPCP